MLVQWKRTGLNFMWHRVRFQPCTQQVTVRKRCRGQPALTHLKPLSHYILYSRGIKPQGDPRTVRCPRVGYIIIRTPTVTPRAQFTMELAKPAHVVLRSLEFVSSTTFDVPIPSSLGDLGDPLSAESHDSEVNIVHECNVWISIPLKQYQTWF